MSSKRPVTTPQDWAKRLEDVPVSKDDLNLLVANYLFTEGYLSAAENFAREAGLPSAPDAVASSSTATSGAGAALGDVDSIRSRMEIRRAVLRGEVESALDQVVDLDLEILDLDPSLHFHLLQQHLIELIRAGEVGHALAFAQNELAPLAEEHPRFLKELERTMALLAFELPVLGGGGGGEAASAGAPASERGAAVPDAAAALAGHGTKKSKKGTSSSSKAAAADALPPMPPHISSLLDPSQRLRTARELNAAILHAQGHPAEPKLPGLMSVMTWGEGLLAEKGVEWPKWDLHALLTDKTAASSGAAASNGDGDAMVL
ncbi:hypothetical protein JCM9279_000907 [Rhodotorula babjevae]